jgi:hypothetical protein
MNRPSPLASFLVTLAFMGMLAVAVGGGFVWGYVVAVAVTR